LWALNQPGLCREEHTNPLPVAGWHQVHRFMRDVQLCPGVRGNFLQRSLGRRGERLARRILHVRWRLDATHPESQQPDDVPGHLGRPDSLPPRLIHSGSQPLSCSIANNNGRDFIDAFPGRGNFTCRPHKHRADIALITCLHNDGRSHLERLHRLLRKVINSNLAHVGRRALRKRHVKLDGQLWRPKQSPGDGDLCYTAKSRHATVSSKGSTMNGSTSCMNSWRPTRSRMPATSAGTIGTAGSRGSDTDSNRLEPYTNGRP